MTDLAKLNRLRVNAGKTELKAWKASKDALAEAITTLEAAGHTDVLPGANVAAEPSSDDPAIKPLLESAMADNIAKTEDKPADPVKKPRASLARGLDTDQMARQSRYAVRVDRENEAKEGKAARKAAKKAAKEAKKNIKLSKADKKQIKDEAEDRKSGIAGKVDPKVDPEKAKRQEKHVADKKAKREATPKVEKNTNEVTVAELCRELDIDPKVGRAKLRRHEDKLAKLHTKGQDRWTFPKTAADTIKKILKP